jgi:hypothetical protein
MEFFDFEIRAWRASKARIQVIVHSSPAGDMEKPTRVVFDEQKLGLPQRTSFARTPTLQIATGRKLSAALLPRPVQALLSRSLVLIGPGSGLRLRLCLDETLVNLPWEYLYRPDAPTPDSVAGFLVLDPRISIVRGAPTTTQTLEASEKSQRLIFAGMIEGGERRDRQRVREEFQRISKSLEPIGHLLSAEFVTGGGDQIETALQQPAAIFHFSGYTSAENGKGFLVREVDVPPQPDYPRLYSETISDLLTKSGTQLAFFNANNSCKWVFTEPFVRAGMPAIIGMQEATSVDTSIVFAEQLYASLARGLSLDEAVTWARLRLLQAPLSNHYEWGQFVVYMPTAAPILLPRPKRPEVLQYQEEALQQRQRTVAVAIETMGQQPGGQPPVNKRRLRAAMFGAFDKEELDTLCADVEQNLADDGIKLQVSLDAVGKDVGLENKVLQLIEYLDRRSCLPYLVSEVRQVRPLITF